MPEHPIIAALAFLTALPFGWPIIRAFASSVEDEVEDATRNPLLAQVAWFPEWTVMKVVWLLIVLAALTIAFYKLYTYLGGWIGIV